jgi:hypothetical protein
MSRSPSTHETLADLDNQIDRSTRDSTLAAALKSILLTARVDGLIGSTALGSTVAELNLLDGSTEANSVASVVPVLDTGKELVTDANTGTAGTGVTAVEHGDGKVHTTTLTLAATAAAIAGGADLGIGNLIYTFPSGAVIIDASYMSAAFTESDGNITADQPEVGLGTVIASGAISVLSTTTENIITGQVAANCSGTATVKTAIPTAAVPFVIETGDAHTLHLNWADGWAASGETAGSITGTVVINWRFMS